MSERKKPSELSLIVNEEAGQVFSVEPEKTPTEQLSEKWSSNLYRGASVLDMEPQRWTVPGWLPSDSLIAIYAAPGMGKSFYALTMALEIARGGEWIGTPIEAAPVLYVAAERGTVLRDRLEAWMTHTEEPLPDSLLLMSEPRPPQLTNPSHVSALCELIKREGVRFVVLDTYAQMTQGLEENSVKDVGPVLDSLAQIRQATNGGIVSVVHHSGKDSSKGLRGSSAFLGAVDLSIEIASGGDGRISATVRKSNAGAEPMPEWYKLESVPLSPYEGATREAAVLTHTGAPSLGGALKADILELLRTNYPTGSASKKELLEDLEEAGRKCSESNLRRYLSAMVKAGELIIEGSSSRTRYRIATY